MLTHTQDCDDTVPMQSVVRISEMYLCVSLYTCAAQQRNDGRGMPTVIVSTLLRQFSPNFPEKS